MGTLLRRRSMIAAGGGSPTPPVVMVPYIRNSGGAYINTGITPDDTTRVIVWARNFNPNGGTLFGCRVAFGNNAFYVATNSGANSCRMSINYGSVTEYPADTQERYLSNYHKYEMNANELLVDDTTIATCGGTFSGNNLNISLFGLNTNGTVTSSPSPIDICACKIYKGGVLVRDYTPVNSPSVGLYDAVSDTVFTNAGGGSFTYGEFDRNAYTPLEYVECTGASYFDTGINGTYSLPIVAKFQPRSNAPRFSAVLGSRTSSSAGMCYFQVGNATRADAEFSFNFNNTMSAMWLPGVSQTGHDFVFVKNNNTATIYENHASKGDTTVTAASTFSTTYPMYIGAFNNAGSSVNGFMGYLYFVGFSSAANFVPAKKGNKVGMYDTYNDVFKESESSTPFVAGPKL